MLGIGLLYQTAMFVPNGQVRFDTRSVNEGYRARASLET